MRRIGLILIVSLTVVLFTAGAQQYPGRAYKVAIIATAARAEDITEASTNPYVRSFFGELRRLGYVEGRNLVVERRSALGRPEDFAKIASEVVRVKPDVIVVFSARLAQAVKAATSTIPIVGAVFAPVESRLATSLARPGSNFTGLAEVPDNQILGKWLSLLHEAAPHASRVGFLSLSRSWNSEIGRTLRGAGQQLGIDLTRVPMEPTARNF